MHGIHKKIYKPHSCRIVQQSGFKNKLLFGHKHPLMGRNVYHEYL